MAFFTIPASITSSIEAATTAATDLVNVGGQACDLCGTLGATVGGDAIALAKEAEKKIQETIPKIAGNVGALKGALNDLSPLLDQAEKAFDGYFAAGGFQGVPSLPSLENLPGGFPSVPGLPGVDGSIPSLPSLPPALASLQSSITGAMSSFGATAAGITSAITAKVGDVAASVEALIPPLSLAVQTSSAGGCKGIMNQLNSLGSDLVPAFDAIKTQVLTQSIPSLEPQVMGLLDAAKNMAESAATQFTANQAAIESAADAMKNNLTSQLAGIGI